MRTVAAALLLLLGCGCSPAGDGAGSSPDGPASPSGSPAAVEEPLPCVPGAEPFTGPAAEELGAEEVMSAYCWLVGLAEAQQGTSLARPVPAQHPRDLAALREALTPRAAAGWARLVRARTAGTGAAARRLDGLTIHDVRRLPDGYATEPGGPYLYGTRFLPGTADLARGGEALEVTFTLETGLVLLERGDDSGRHSLLPVTRTASYVVVPDGDGWLVDDWQAEFEHGQVRLATR